jgi:hypothetical protein
MATLKTRSMRLYGGVLEGPLPGNPDELDVDLDRLPRLGLFEQFQLPRRPLPCPPQVGQAEVVKGPLDGAHREPDVMRSP